MSNPINEGITPPLNTPENPPKKLPNPPVKPGNAKQWKLQLNLL